MRLIPFIAIVLLFSCVHIPREFAHEVTLTTGVGLNSRPVDVRDSFSFDDSRLYVHVAFMNIPLRQHDIHIEVFDGNRDLVYTGGRPFTPNERSWNVWEWHQIDPVTEAPGRWRILVYLDDDLIEELRVRVRG